LLLASLGILPRGVHRVSAENVRHAAAHVFHASWLAARLARRNGPALDDAEQPHERAQTPEPDGFAHAARQPASLRRQAAQRACGREAPEAADRKSVV